MWPGFLSGSTSATTQRAGPPRGGTPPGYMEELAARLDALRLTACRARPLTPAADAGTRL
jgi:hypothetical protein